MPQSLGLGGGCRQGGGGEYKKEVNSTLCWFQGQPRPQSLSPRLPEEDCYSYAHVPT